MPKLPSDKEMVVFEEMLAKTGAALYGQQLVNQRPDELVDSAIYTILARMVARGFVVARDETDEERKQRGGRGPSRRLYEVTDYGRQAYQSRVEAEKAMRKVEAKIGAVKPEGSL